MQVSDWVSVAYLAAIVLLCLIYLFAGSPALRERAWRLLELIFGGPGSGPS